MTRRVALDPREEAVVSLLVAGHTDASAARRLHLSPRTVTNVLRTLMDRMGVNNRFQLGIAIGVRSADRRTPGAGTVAHRSGEDGMPAPRQFRS